MGVEMRVRSRRKTTLAALWLLALLLIGCAVTGQARFYTLESLAGVVPRAEQKGPKEAPIIMGVGPVSLPEYLNRPQIVTRVGKNELRMSEFDRWAEPLKDNISSVLIENLRSLLSPDDISISSWKGRSHIDYRLTVDFIRFDVTAEGEATLVARWSLLRRGTKDIKPINKAAIITLRVAAKGDGYNARVAALNRTLEEFSQEIAKTLRGLPEYAHQKT